jgi:UDP-N-acetylglucosamine acyltransferase
MSNFIHPTAIIGDSVVFGDNNYVGPFCHITGNTIIGNNNRFESFCSIGSSAEHVSYKPSGNESLLIGDDNIFREYVSINLGTLKKTVIGNNIKMFRSSHVGHDTVIEDNVTITSNSVVAGNCRVMNGANLGLSSVIHQDSVIGSYSILGMGCVVWKKNKIEPCKMYFGNPAKCIGMNDIGIQRNNIGEDKIKILIDEYEKITKKSE